MYRAFERLNRISEFWFAPAFWGIEFCSWLTSCDWALDLHWSSWCLLATFATLLVMVTLFPLLALNVVLWLAAAPLILLYAIGRQVAKLWN